MRSQESREAGVTLIEALVTTTLLTLVGGLVFTAVLTLNQAVAVADNVTFDQGFGRNALTLVSRDMRAAAPIQQSSAPAFRTASPRVAEFTALLDQGLRPQLVRVEIDSESRLLVTATRPDPASVAPDLVYDPADRQQRYIASFVVNPAAIFRYFDEDGNELNSFVAGGSLSAADRADIATVEIVLLLNRAPVLTGASELELTVRLPNAGANN